MIVDKVPLPEDPTPTDAPPSYETVQPTPLPSSSSYPAEKPDSPNPYALSPNSASSPLASCKPPLSKGKGKSSWFGFGQAARVAREVKATVIGLIRDVVKNSDTDIIASISILTSCDEACRAHDIPFSSVLQEKSIEGHSPIYWAIVKRPPANRRDNGPELVTTLLSMATPLIDATISEIRLACLDNSDQELFQHLRQSTAFAPLSGTDQMLLGESALPDDIETEDVPGDMGAFAVHFRIPSFQKRMRISKEVKLEFIARGRIWRLRFFIADQDLTVSSKHVQRGKWVISLAILEHSPPTWLDARLVIEDPNIEPSHQWPPRTGSSASDGVSPSPSAPVSPRPLKPKPTIELRLRTNYQQLQPSTKWQHDDVAISLEESLLGSSLQYEGSSYIHSDGSLYARLEAKLAKSDSPECVIC